VYVGSSFEVIKEERKVIVMTICYDSHFKMQCTVYKILIIMDLLLLIY